MPRKVVPMTGLTALRCDVDPGGLPEYSVVYTDRALNHMSRRFVGVMQDIVSVLKSTYHASAVAVVPGGGTFGMEAIVCQFAHDKKCLVVHNGFFSYRRSPIIEMGEVTNDVTVLAARTVIEAPRAPWAPAPVDEVVAAIREQKPELVFAPHVETASGMVLPDDHVRAIAAATHEGGGLFVLDGIASGAMWVDMTDLGVDLLVSAPQKDWSGSPCGAFVMFGPAARTAIEGTTSSSFALDLKKWLTIAEGYALGQHSYHATMPTDALAVDALAVDALAVDALAVDAQRLKETRDRGLDLVRRRQVDLGAKVRAVLAERGFASVAARGFEAPGVAVCFADDPEVKNVRKFLDVGVQAAAGVPLQCGAGPDFSTVRLGLFGLDTWDDIDAAVARLADALDQMGYRA